MYRLAIEAKAIDGRYHAVAEEGIPMRDIATLIGRRLGIRVLDLSLEQAREHFGWFAGFASMDAAASSAWTRQRLGWFSNCPGLVDDLEHAGYFEA